MKIVGLISGGKDSIYNLMQCVAHGHEIICVANLHPKKIEELDSLMFQSVGVEIAALIAKALGVPILLQEIKGKSKSVQLTYEEVTEGDEVEDLFELLSKVRA